MKFTFFSLNRAQLLEILIHLVCWILIFDFPFLLMEHGNPEFADRSSYFLHLIVPLSFGAVFYGNYFVLIPRFFFKKQHRRYLIYNIGLIVVVTLLLHLSYECRHLFGIPHLYPDRPPLAPSLPPEHPPFEEFPPFRFISVFRDMVLLVFTSGLSVAIRMSGLWVRRTQTRFEAESMRKESELRNLRNQFSPHFLLNTLNNIYALIAFDSDKAQFAVMELGKLLHYTLYEGHQKFVPLQKEVGFIQNYIELMRLRINKHVDVKVTIDVAPDSKNVIAPFVFISLIENAFKHGIASTECSFVDIRIAEDTTGRVVCFTRNSNFPKTLGDKSGSGIGLEQVKRRLQLIYPDRYVWKYGPEADGLVYVSELTLFTAGDKLEKIEKL